MVGSVGGGLLLDHYGSSVRNGFRMMVFWVLFGGGLLTCAFAIPGLSWAAFLVLLFLSMLLLTGGWLGGGLLFAACCC